MSIRMHILLMLLWEMFWLPFLMFSGYVVGALVVNHEAAIFVGIVVGFFFGSQHRTPRRLQRDVGSLSLLRDADRKTNTLGSLELLLFQLSADKTHGLARV